MEDSYQGPYAALEELQVPRENLYTLMRCADLTLAKHGLTIYGGRQPKRALAAVKPLLEERGVFLRMVVQVRRSGMRSRGFVLQCISEEPVQTRLPDGGTDVTDFRAS